MAKVMGILEISKWRELARQHLINEEEVAVFCFGFFSLSHNTLALVGWMKCGPWGTCGVLEGVSGMLP